MLITEKINVSFSIAIFDSQATTIDKVSTVNLLAEWIAYTSVLHLTEPAKYTGSYTALGYYKVKQILQSGEVS